MPAQSPIAQSSIELSSTGQSSTAQTSITPGRRGVLRRVLNGGLALGLLSVAAMLWVGAFGGMESSDADERRLILRQLAFVRGDVDEADGARRMQQLFPEGACFLYTLYGLTWANLARRADADEPLRARARAEIDWALDGQETPASLRPFLHDTQVPGGVFWAGQRNLLLAELMSLTARGDRSAPREAEFHRQSRELSAAFAEAGGPLEAYPGLCWPCDSVAAVVSLRLHDRLYGEGRGQAFDTFLDWAAANSDPETGMLPGRVEFGSWEQAEPARGCANSWNLALYARVDPELARERYVLYREHFGVTRLGLRGFREWPRHDERDADVDSGPILWDMGVTATGLGLATARAVGDLRTADDVEAFARMVGLRIDSEEETRYLLGQLPIGDAFLAYARSVPLPDGVALDTPSAWVRFRHRWPFHLLLAAYVAVIVLAFRFDRRRSRARDAETA